MRLLTYGSILLFPDSDSCQKDKCGFWTSNTNMTWQEAGGRCWVMQGSYYCQCTDAFKGNFCRIAAVTGISRSTVIVIIVVVVMAIILITLICAFLCARYIGADEDDELIVYEDEDDVVYEDSTMRSVYSTLSRGKAIAYNDATFQGQPVILETISGKTSRYR